MRIRRWQRRLRRRRWRRIRRLFIISELALCMHCIVHIFIGLEGKASRPKRSGKESRSPFSSYYLRLFFPSFRGYHHYRSEHATLRTLYLDFRTSNLRRSVEYGRLTGAILDTIDKYQASLSSCATYMYADDTCVGKRYLSSKSQRTSSKLAAALTTNSPMEVKETVYSFAKALLLASQQGGPHRSRNVWLFFIARYNVDFFSTLTRQSCSLFEKHTGKVERWGGTAIRLPVCCFAGASTAKQTPSPCDIGIAPPDEPSQSGPAHSV